MKFVVDYDSLFRMEWELHLYDNLVVILNVESDQQLSGVTKLDNHNESFLHVESYSVSFKEALVFFSVYEVLPDGSSQLIERSPPKKLRIIGKQVVFISTAGPL